MTCAIHPHGVDREAARWSVFKYVEMFYNPRRLHHPLGHRPDQFDAEHAPAISAKTTHLAAVRKYWAIAIPDKPIFSERQMNAEEIAEIDFRFEALKPYLKPNPPHFNAAQK